MDRRSGVQLALLGLVGLIAGDARAQSSDVGVVWIAPAPCPPASELRARIEHRLGGPLDPMAIQGVGIVVSIDGEGAARRFVARIATSRDEMHGPISINETRVLNSAGCDELTDAVALVIARIVVERGQSAAVVRAPATSVVARTPEGRGVWGGGVRALGISGIGALPGVGVAGELAGYVRRRDLFVEIAAARWAQTARAFSLNSDEVSLDLKVLRIGWEPADLPLRAWVVGELGAYAGVMIEYGQTRDTRWSAAGAGFGVGWRMVKHARLFGMIEFVAALQRAQFVLPDRHEGYRPDSVSARSGFGLEVGWQ